MTKITDKQALEELKRSIDEIDKVRKKPRLSPKFKGWQIETSEFLEKVYGRKSKQVKDFDRIPYSLATFSNQTTESKFDDAFHGGLQNAAIFLSSIVKEIQTNGIGGKPKYKEQPSRSPVEPVVKIVEKPAPMPVTTTSIKSPVSAAPKASAPVEKEPAYKANLSPTTSNKILVVYAGGTSLSTELTEFLIKIGLQPVLVNDKPGQHEQLLDALEENFDASYAIALLDSNKTNSDNDVVFELGVLLGQLGRDRVCGLYTNIPIDFTAYSSISHVSIDVGGAWKFMMIKNLKDCGFDVDANLAL
jgi:hypothetical protein